MAETLNGGEYGALRTELRDKQIGSVIMGTVGMFLLGVAVAAAIVATGGGAAIPLIGGMGATGAGILAAVAGVFGIGASWKAVQSDLEVQMDFGELRARRNAIALKQVLGDKELSPQQAAVVATTMAQSQEPNYPQNQRGDGRQWGDVVTGVTGVAITADAVNNLTR